MISHDRYNKARAIAEQKVEREPTDEEIMAEDHRLDINTLLNIHQSKHEIKSIYETMTTSSDVVFEDILADSDSQYDLFDNKEYNEIMVKKALSILNRNPKELHMVMDYFGLNGLRMTYDDIADKHKLSKERCRQIITKAINKIRNHKKQLYESNI
jgi:DNA-directed RNA polymerase sigma subunit (sigma70/sigma32)